MTSPYSGFGNDAFWSRSVASNFDAVDLARRDAPYLKHSDKIMSAGSCFAANIIPYITEAGFDYLYTERRPGIFRVPSENLSYDKFSAGYGNIYTARQLRQLLDQCLGLWQPAEEIWENDGQFIDPFRPGLRYKARSLIEFRALKQQHLNSVKAAFQQATVFVFTLGLTECWLSTADGAVFPACPGTVAGTFDQSRHAFKNLSAAEVAADLDGFITRVRGLNPDLRIILTVSPVPLVATATGRHVLSSTIYSKSALRVAAEDMINTHDNIMYFPAYEIVTGPQAPFDSFEEDRRNVSKAAVEVVMNALLRNSESGTPDAVRSDRAKKEADDADVQKLTRSIVEYECEEAMSDRRLG